MEKISKLMEIVSRLCEEEGVSFHAKFKQDVNGNEEYHYNNGEFVFNTTDLITMVQHWEAKHNEKLFN